MLNLRKVKTIWWEVLICVLPAKAINMGVKSSKKI